MMLIRHCLGPLSRALIRSRPVISSPSLPTNEFTGFAHAFGTVPPRKPPPGRIIEIPEYCRIKDLSQILNISASEIETAFTFKSNRRYFTYNSGKWFQFPSLSEVILPFDTVKLYCEKIRKIPAIVTSSSGGRKTAHKSALIVKAPPFEQILLSRSASRLENSLSSCNAYSHVPVVAILGHFNHGKTTLLDKLGGTDFCKTEAHGITQVIRSRFITLNSRLAQEGKGEGVYDGCVTFIDTPGQDIFYRMRNSGANKCDVAVLVVAMDQGIVEQTMESIGIIEGLGCPAVVVLNKMDVYSSDQLGDRISELTKEIREYKALSNAHIVCISAKTGLNMDVFEKTLGTSLASIFPSVVKDNGVDSLANAKLNNQKRPLEAEKIDAQGKIDLGGLLETISATGFVLDIGRSKSSGYFMQILLQSGRMQKGDMITAGGIRGTIKRIEYEDSIEECFRRFESSSVVKTEPSRNERSTINPKDVGSDVAVVPGTVVRLILGVEDDFYEPKPLGQSITCYSTSGKASLLTDNTTLSSTTGNCFGTYSDLWKQQKEAIRFLQTYNSQVSNRNMNGPLLLSSVLKKNAAVVKTLQKDTLHIVDQERMELLLPNYEMNEEQVAKFSLPSRFIGRFRSTWASVDPFLSAMIADSNETTLNSEQTQEDSESSSDDEMIEEPAERGSKGAHRSKDRGGVVERNDPVTVIVKADTELALGTFQDCIADFIEEQSLHDGSGDNDSNKGVAESVSREAPVGLCEVVKWGVGDISPSDVSIAKSTNAIILSYNTKFESLAYQQLQQNGIKHVQAERMQDVISLLTTSMKYKMGEK